MQQQPCHSHSNALLALARAAAANDAGPPAHTAQVPRAAAGASYPLRCAALARLVLSQAEALGLLLPASTLAVDLLVAGNPAATSRAMEATFPAHDDPRAALAAGCVARLAVEAAEGGGDPEYLRRCAAAVLGQLGARDATHRVEDAWRRPL